MKSSYPYPPRIKMTGAIFSIRQGRTSRTEASGKGISENCWKTTKLEQTDSQAFSIPYPVKALEGYIQIQKA